MGKNRSTISKAKSYKEIGEFWENHDRVMKIAPITKIKTQFDTYIKACRNEPVVLTDEGQIVAVLLSISDEEQLEQLVLTHSSAFQRILETGKQQINEGKGILHKDFWEQMETKL